MEPIKPLAVDLWTEIEVPKGDGVYERIMFFKAVEFMTLPTLGSHVILDQNNSRYTAKVTRIILVPYDKTDLHHTAAWIYCCLENSEYNDQERDRASIELIEEFGWEIL